MPEIAVLTGAGLSVESGLPTFRGINGLWEGHKIQEVATQEAFYRSPALVHKFYNQRRAQCRKAQPNPAHFALAKLANKRDTALITQNIDDLLERAGCEEVTHLHGHIGFARSSINYDYLVPIERDLGVDDLAPDGSLLRPHVVWFGEEVRSLPYARRTFATAKVVLIVGTSLQVYPASSLLEEVADDAAIFVIDPNKPSNLPERAIWITQAASIGVPEWVESYL